jgi:meromycolic acid enoyl-[acyl-carrier-protein] reductase
VLLSGFGRTDVLALDVNSPADLDGLAGTLSERWGHLDGLLHAVAYAPPDALGGGFMATPAESATVAFQTSAFSLKALGRAVLPLLEGSDSAGIVGLDFDASVAWPVYDWMGVAKAALESITRYMARDLGASSVRVNLVSAGPLRTLAAGGIPGFDQLAESWSKVAPLAWDEQDAGPVADAACFLLSDLARGITGEILHVDGGYHAMGAPTR